MPNNPDPGELIAEAKRLVAGITCDGDWRAVAHPTGDGPREKWWTVDSASGMHRQIARVMSMTRGPEDANLMAVAPRMVTALASALEQQVARCKEHEFAFRTIRDHSAIDSRIRDICDAALEKP